MTTPELSIEERFSEICWIMLDVVAMGGAGADETTIDEQLEALDAMMVAHWPDILEEISIEKIRESLAWLG